MVTFNLRRHLIKLILSNDQVYYTGLCDKHENIIVSITPEDNDKPVTGMGLQERLELVIFIHTKLLELVTTFMKASHPPIPYMSCTRCYEPHIALDDDVVGSSKVLRCHGNTKLEMEYYSGLRYCQGTVVAHLQFIQMCFPHTTHAVH